MAIAEAANTSEQWPAEGRSRQQKYSHVTVTRCNLVRPASTADFSEGYTNFFPFPVICPTLRHGGNASHRVGNVELRMLRAVRNLNITDAVLGELT
jgi:hypothetical protein